MDLLQKIRFAGAKLRRLFYRTPREQAFARWLNDRGDRTLRLSYPLDETSTVFDVGGYEGQWAADIFDMYRCRIIVFEPVLAHAEDIAHRFATIRMIEMCPFGLAGSDREETVALDADGSSVFRSTGRSETVRMVEAARFIRARNILQIDLMKVNIEGGEYELLEHLLDEGLMERIVNLQVQFHDYVEDAVRRMGAIRRRLSRTHEPTWQYEFIWENWRRREKSP